MNKKTLRPYQVEAVKQTLHRIGQGVGPILVEIFTSGGKSLVISEIINSYPNYKILVATHRKELLKQNTEELRGYCDRPSTFFCAALKEKVFSDLTFSNISSLIRVKEIPVDYDLIIIDECHRCSSKNGYGKLFEKIPNAKIVGLTATPYRMDGGSLRDIKNGIFKSFIKTIDIKEALVQGYLTPISHLSNKDFRISDEDRNVLKVVNKEFSLEEAREAMLKEDLTKRCLERDLIKYLNGRNKVLVFCVDIEHANMANDILLDKGESSVVITSHTKEGEREEYIDDFKYKDIRFLVSVGVFTEGFNVTNIDAIIMLRPTMSPVLWSQVLGRGNRLAEGKKDCIVIDHAGNTNVLGTFDDIQYRHKKGKRSEIKFKECPKCDVVTYVNRSKCKNCGYDFFIRQDGAIKLSEDIIDKLEYELDVHAFEYGMEEHGKILLKFHIKENFFSNIVLKKYFKVANFFTSDELALLKITNVRCITRGNVKTILGVSGFEKSSETPNGTLMTFHNDEGNVVIGQAIMAKRAVNGNLYLQLKVCIRGASIKDISTKTINIFAYDGNRRQFPFSEFWKLTKIPSNKAYWEIQESANRLVELLTNNYRIIHITTRKNHSDFLDIKNIVCVPGTPKNLAEIKEETEQVSLFHSNS